MVRPGADIRYRSLYRCLAGVGVSNCVVCVDEEWCVAIFAAFYREDVPNVAAMANVIGPCYCVVTNRREVKLVGEGPRRVVNEVVRFFLKVATYDVSIVGLVVSPIVRGLRDAKYANVQVK